MRHKHRFVAIPITGQNAWNGREALFGYRLECEQCGRRAKPGNLIEEVKASHWQEIHPEPVGINYVLKEAQC